MPIRERHLAHHCKDCVICCAASADAVVCAVIHYNPLAVEACGSNAGRVLAPAISVVVANGAIHFSWSFQINKVRVALVVRFDIRIASTGRTVRPEVNRANHVELVAAIDRAVDPRLRSAKAERTRLPVIAVLVYIIEGFTFSPLGID